MSKVRVQLDLSRLEVQSLDALRDRLAPGSRAAAVKTALAVLDWVATETERGNRIYAVGPGHVSNLELSQVSRREE